MKRMNMKTISISDIQRNLHKLDNFDIVEIVDKKRHQVKGYFLDKKYHDMVMELFNKENNKKNDFFNTLKKRNIHIDSSINIDNLMNEMNDGLS